MAVMLVIIIFTWTYFAVVSSVSKRLLMFYAGHTDLENGALWWFCVFRLAVS